MIDHRHPRERSLQKSESERLLMQFFEFSRKTVARF